MSGGPQHKKIPEKEAQTGEDAEQSRIQDMGYNKGIRDTTRDALTLLAGGTHILQ